MKIKIRLIYPYLDVANNFLYLSPTGVVRKIRTKFNIFEMTFVHGEEPNNFDDDLIKQIKAIEGLDNVELERLEDWNCIVSTDGKIEHPFTGHKIKADKLVIETWSSREELKNRMRAYRAQIEDAEKKVRNLKDNKTAIVNILKANPEDAVMVREG
jgi:hypothetical protein